MRAIPCSITVLATLAGLASLAGAGPLAAYLPYPDAMHLPHRDWELPFDAGMPLLASAPYLDAVPPGPACPLPHVTTTAPPTGAGRPSSYPRAELDRPPVLPLGIVTASLDTLAAPASAPLPAHVAGVAMLAAGLPHGSDLRVGFHQPTAGDGAPTWLSVGTGLRLLRTPWLAVNTRSSLSYDPIAARWGTSTSGVRVAARLGRIGVILRPEQLTFDFLRDTAPRFTVPLAAGVQVTPTLWMQVEGDLHVAEWIDDRPVRRGISMVPMGLAAVASVAPRLDLRARFAGDVGGEGLMTSSVGWSLGLAYHLGG